ncbi:MAG: oligosaccharide flippase family protein, partial [Ignavibacteriales bacterium]|nr:oligosaccharide flippase family protein [Ignavibacteriales bacterium]
LPVGYGSLLSQIVLSLPIILLGLFASVRNVGDFSAAWKITFFLLAVDRAVYLLFYPLVARTFAERPDALPVLLNRILRYTMLALVPLSIGLAVTSRPLVLFVFGDGFSSAAPMLHLLSLYFFFTVLNSIFGYALIAVGGEKRYSYVMT